MKRPYVLSIAGYDPCNGAGIGSDLKTFEQLAVYGLGVVTSITYQNESNFYDLKWLAFEDIQRQLQALAEKYIPSTVKIGIIKSASVLDQTLKYIKTLWPETFVIWDPILKASAGFSFHQDLSGTIRQLIHQQIDLITPNIPEYKELFHNMAPLDIVNQLEAHLLIKGGHSNGTNVCDELYSPDSKQVKILSEKVAGDLQKHGTGCVLSSAIAAYLAQGLNLKEACHKAHFYVKSFIASNNSLLGYHSSENN